MGQSRPRDHPRGRPGWPSSHAGRVGVAGRADLRLFAFAPAAAGRLVDARLRHDIAPRIAELAGLTGLFLARRVGDSVERRIIATVWIDPEAMDVGLHAGGLAGIEADLQGEAEVLSLELEILDDRPLVPTVLRIFRGTVRSGALDRYVELAREGTGADMAADIGPIALYLAPQPPQSVITVSLWADWDRIMQATGGKLDKPIATRHADQLVRAQVEHFEVIPAPAGGLIPQRSAVD